MKDRIRKILIVFMVLLAAGCGIYLFWYYQQAAKSSEATDKAKEQAYKTEKQEKPEETDAPQIPIDFASLQAVNPDVYAWIHIEGTNIDYPVVQSREDNTYYLDHSWEKKDLAAGAIFTQTYNHQDFQDYNTVIYGHRMSDANPTMFHDLHNYMDMDYLKQHQDVIIYTPEHIFTYKIFAAVVYDDKLIPSYYNFTIEEQRQNFLDSIYASTDLRNQFADDMEVGTQDRLLTLSTCLEGEASHRFLVEAVLVDEK